MSATKTHRTRTVELTADEVAYLVADLRFSIVMHRAQLADPDAASLGVNVPKVRAALETEEGLFRKLSQRLGRRS